jgi:minimal CRISPR polymerase domain
MGARVIMAAGDDLLAQVAADNFDRIKLGELAEEFRAQTGSSISFGVGPTIESSYINLRRAKSSRTERVVEAETHT